MPKSRRLSKSRSRSRSPKSRSRGKSRSRSPKSRGGSLKLKKFSFYAYYDAKPRVNKKLETSGIEFEDRGESIIFSGNVKANSKETVKKWLKSLGHVTKWEDSTRDAMEVHDM